MPDRPDVSPQEPGCLGDAHCETVNVSGRLENVLEALLLASESPLSVEQLQRLVGDGSIDRKELRAVLRGLEARYSEGATELREVAGGWRLQIRPEYAPWVARLWQERPPRISRAMLETLALIIYRQPITRGEIEDVRGVAVSTGIIRTLLERGWIRELGYKEIPGRPILYGTTTQLLDDLNLKSLDQLPDLPEIRDPEQLENALRRLGVDPQPQVAVQSPAVSGNDEGMRPSGSISDQVQDALNEVDSDIELR